MPGKDLKFSIVATFRDKASRKVKRFFSGVQKQAKRANQFTGSGGLAEMFSGGGLGAFGGFAQGGVGGMFTGVMQGATRLLTMPAKILSGFSRLIPGIGNIFSGVLSTATNLLQGIADTAANVVGGIINVFAGLAQKLGGILGKIAKRGSQAFLAVAGYATYHAGKIEDAWNEVRTIIDLGDASERVKRQLRNLSIETGRSLQEVIGGYYEVLSAGIKEPRKAFKFLETSLKGAVGGAADFGTVVQALSRTLRVFEIPVEKSREVMDQLLKTVDLGQIKFPELANSIGPLATAVKAANGELKGALASLGMLAQTGPVDIVATQLRGFFLALAKPAQQTQKVLEDLRKQGLDLSRQALGRKGLVGYLRDLEKVDQDTLQQLFPDRRAFLGAKNLLSMVDEIEGAISGIGSSEGKTESNFEKRMDGLIKQAGRAWRAIQDLLLEFGGPIAAKLATRFEAIPDAIKDWRGVSKAAGTAVANALDGVLERGEALYSFFSEREWTWKGIKKLPRLLGQDVLPMIAALFGKMTEEGFEPGPVIDALVAAFQWAAAKIEGILSVLWERVARDLTQTLMDAVAGVGRSIQTEIMAKNEQAVEEWYNTSALKAPERMMYGEYDELSEEQKERERTAWSVTHPVQDKIQSAGSRIGEALADTATALRPKTLSDDEQQEAVSNARADAEKKATGAAKDLGKALNDLEKAVRDTAQTAGREVEEALPKKSTRDRQKKQLSADRQQDDDRERDARKDRQVQQELAGTDMWKKLNSRLGKAQYLAGQLEKAGYTEKAGRKEEEAAAIKASMAGIQQAAIEQGGVAHRIERMMNVALRDPQRAQSAYAPEKEEEDKRETPKSPEEIEQRLVQEVERRYPDEPVSDEMVMGVALEELGSRELQDVSPEVVQRVRGRVTAEDDARPQRKERGDPEAKKAVNALEQDAGQIKKMQERGVSGQKIAAAARDFSQRVVEVMEMLHESQDATEKHLKKMERRVDRLATARTR